MAHSEIGDAPARVLRGMYELEREQNRERADESEGVSSSDIRERLGISNQLLNYHIEQLIDNGLIERVGSVDVGAPYEAHTYSLTPDGQKIAASVDGRNAVSNEVRELREQIEQLRTLNDRLWDRIEDADARIDGHDDRLDNHEKAIHVLSDQIDDE